MCFFSVIDAKLESRAKRSSAMKQKGIKFVVATSSAEHAIKRMFHQSVDWSHSGRSKKMRKRRKILKEKKMAATEEVGLRGVAERGALNC